MKKKNLLWCALVIVGMVALVGCDQIEIRNDSGLASINIGGRASVQGSGSVESRDFDVADFTGINISGNYEVIWQQASSYSLVIEMQENLFDYLEVAVRGNTLHIDSSRSFNTTSANRPRIYIESPSIDSANFAGAINASNWDSIQGANFSVDTSGAVNLTFDLQVMNFQASLAGAGDLTLTGQADVANVSSSGASTVEALDLQTKAATISITGAGNVNVAVSDDLTVSLTGAGRVRYVGDPTITSTIIGPGSVQHQ